MPSSRFGQPSSWIPFDVTVLSSASKFLMVYGALTLLACGLTYLFSLSDVRALREVGIWVKPMKFMAATALFAWTTVWVTELVNAPLTHGQAYRGICILLVVTSFFEVAYITYQASQGAASHYNTSDPWHAFMFGLMAIAAVGLTAHLLALHSQRLPVGRKPAACRIRAAACRLASLQGHPSLPFPGRTCPATYSAVGHLR